MVEFEKTYRDRITNYTGVATARTEYAHDSSPSVRLTSIGKDGRPEDVWLAETRLEEVADRESTGFFKGQPPGDIGDGCHAD